MTRVVVPSSGKTATIEVARQIVDAVGAQEPIDLDFTDFKSRNVAWGAVLSNVLTGSLHGAKSLSVHFPEAIDAHVRLARSGLYFALARQDSLDWNHLDPAANSTLARWTSDWRPSDLQRPLVNLVQERAVTEETDEFDSRLVAFLNPDRAPREEAPGDTAAVVVPWLRTLIGSQASNNAARLKAALSIITWELLDNIREWSEMRPDQNCSLVTFATRGRPDLVHVCVMDTGIGIISSLTRRLGEENLSPQDQRELLRQALAGELPPRSTPRGGGLPSVVDITKEYDAAKLFVATGGSDTHGGSLSVELAGNSSQPISATFNRGLKMRGTVVLVTLPLRVLARAAFGSGDGAPNR